MDIFFHFLHALQSLPVWAKYLADAVLCLVGVAVFLDALLQLFGPKRAERPTFGLWRRWLQANRKRGFRFRILLAALFALVESALIALIILLLQPEATSSGYWHVHAEVKATLDMGDFDATKTTAEVESSGGGRAKLAFFVINTGTAFWPIGKDQYPDWSKVDPFFSDPDVRKGMQNSQALICIGLASWKKDKKGSEESQIGLSYRRSLNFCQHLATILGAKHPLLYGFGLGRNQVPSNDNDPNDDDHQRPLVLIQVSDVFGDLVTEVNRQRMVACILYGDKFLGFYPGQYYVTEPRHHEDLRWFRMGDAASNAGSVDPLPAEPCPKSP